MYGHSEMELTMEHVDFIPNKSVRISSDRCHGDSCKHKPFLFVFDGNGGGVLKLNC